MKKKYRLYLTPQEYSMVIAALNQKRNNLINQGRYTDAVDELMIKVSKAKVKKVAVAYI